ncbi:MAG: autotransporter-associated beta strand repeat-containing protein, partial [Verrucomicrobiales bacterium]|nr:autotransporter-associated beta strand repeat-containing protein [Verrucomicrobiales bacterium]
MKFWKKKNSAKTKDSSLSREYVAEALESRILYSGAPVDAAIPEAPVSEESTSVAGTGHSFESIDEFGQQAPTSSMDQVADESQDVAILTSFNNLSSEELQSLAQRAIDYWGGDADLSESQKEALEALEVALVDIVSLSEAGYGYDVWSDGEGASFDSDNFAESTSIYPGEVERYGMDLIVDLLQEVGDPVTLEQFAGNQIAARTTEVARGGQPVIYSSLDLMAVAAEQHWINSGLTADQVAALESIEYHIVELDGTALGYAEGSNIYIDDDAAGLGWFIDSTPEDLSETGFDGVDLVSVLSHEVGHVLGLRDNYDQTDPSDKTDIMHGLFDEDDRREVSSGRADGAEALSLEGAHFATFSWDGGGVNSDWQTAANWNGGTAPDDTGEWDTFEFGASTDLTPNVNFAGDNVSHNVNYIIFRPDAGAYTLTGNKTGGGSIALDMLGASSSAATDGPAQIINQSTETQTIDINLHHRTEYNAGLVFDAAEGDLVIAKRISRTGSEADPVTVQGGHTVTFMGGNTYVQNTVVTGNSTLLLENVSGSGTGTGDVTVESGSTLGGSGSASGTVTIEGALAPGDPLVNNGVGALSLADLNFAAGSSFNVQIDADGSTVAGSGNDVLNVSGEVALGDGEVTLNVASLGMVPAGNHPVYQIINNTSGTISGYFKDGAGNALTEGATLTVGATDYSISYKGGDGNDVVISVGNVRPLSIETTSTGDGNDVDLESITRGGIAYTNLVGAVSAQATGGTIFHTEAAAPSASEALSGLRLSNGVLNPTSVDFTFNAPVNNDRTAIFFGEISTASQIGDNIVIQPLDSNGAVIADWQLTITEADYGDQGGAMSTSFGTSLYPRIASFLISDFEGGAGTLSDVAGIRVANASDSNSDDFDPNIAGTFVLDSGAAPSDLNFNFDTSSTIDENQSVSLSGSFTLGGNTSNTVTIDWGDGSVDSLVLTGGTTDFTSSHLYLNEGDFEVMVQVQAGTISSGLTGLWNFDDGSSTDQTGLGNDGSGGTFGSDTPFGTGQALSSGKIAIPTSDSLETMDDQGTIAFWAKIDPGSTDAWERTIVKAGGGTGWHVGRYSNSTDMNIRVDTTGPDGANNQNKLLGGDDTLDDQWHHIVFTLDNGTAKQYVDGVLVQTQSYSTGDGLSNNGTLYIGDVNLGGSLDEVALWNRILSDDEILQAAGPIEVGGESITGSVTVSDVAPVVDSLQIVSKDAETGAMTLQVDFTDPGSLDEHKAVIDWGDGSTPTEVILATGARTLQSNHTYTSPATHQISVTVLDRVGDAVGIWTFDDGSASDLSGNNNDGTGGGFSTDVADAFGGGNSLDGAGSTVTVANSVSLEGVDDEMTLSFWIKGDTSESNWVRIIRKGTGAQDSTSWMVTRNSATDDLLIRTDTEGTGGTWNRNQHDGEESPILDSTWHHVTYVLNNGVSREYVDGVLTNQETYPHGDGLSNTEALTIGTATNSILLDEVILYDRALSGEQVAALSSAPDVAGARDSENLNFTFGTLVYVNDDWGSSVGDTVDGNLEEGGSQDAIFGTDAFDDLAEAVGALDTAEDVTLIINEGVYGSQTLDLSAFSNNVTVRFVEGTSTFVSLIGGSATTFELSAIDQVEVTGTVNLNGAILNPLTISGLTPVDGEQVTLIDNQGSDPVTGTFSGLEDGAEITALASGDIKAYLSYHGGDGNDVTITFVDTNAYPTVSVDHPGSDGNTNFDFQVTGNTLQILQNGVVILSRPIDTVKTLVINGDDSTGGGEGDDVLTIDYSLDPRLLDIDITFNGLAQSTATGDSLVINGGNFGVVTHNLTATDSGSFDIDGDGTADITYTGLEPIDMTGSTASDLIFNLPVGANPDVVLRNSTNAGEMELDGSTFESTIFTVPSGSITINGNTGTDTITIESLDSSFAGNLLIDAGDSVDSVTVTNNLVFDGNLTITTGDINLNASIDTGSGDQTFNGDVDLQGTASNVVLTAGNIIFNGDTTLLNSDAISLQLSVSGTATNTAGNLFDINDGRFRLLGGTEFINNGTLETGDDGSVPIFADSNVGNKITNNGDFLLNSGNLRLYVTITNTGTGVMTINRPNGDVDLDLKAADANGPGGHIVNRGVITISETGNTKFDENGSVTNESGGVIDFIDGNVSFEANTTFTNNLGADLNLKGDALNLSITSTASFINDGTTTWVAGADGHKTITGSGTFLNNGVFDHAHGGGNDYLQITGSLTFQNNGEFVFTDEGDVNISSASATFENNGLVNKTTDPSTNPSFFFGAGTFNALAGSEVRSTIDGARIHIGTGGSSDATAEWNADGGDIGLGGTWSGTISGESMNGGKFILTDPGSGIAHDITVGAGGLTFNVTGDGLEWADGNLTTNGNSLINKGVITSTSSKALNGTLSNTGTLNVAGDITVTGGEIVNASGGALDFQEGTVTLTGNTDIIRIESGGALTLSTSESKYIAGGGSVVVESGGTADWANGQFDIGADATFQNDGVFNYLDGADDSILTGGGHFINNGEFYHKEIGGNPDNIEMQTSGSRFTNNGLFVFEDAGDVELWPGTEFVNAATGTLRNLGDVSNASIFFYNNGGTGGSFTNLGVIEVFEGTLGIQSTYNALTSPSWDAANSTLLNGEWIVGNSSDPTNGPTLDFTIANGGIEVIGEDAIVRLTGADARFLQLTDFLAQVDGSLTLNLSQALDAADSITVTATGTLAGDDGRIIGDVTVQSGGTLSPGDGDGDTGVLTVTGNVNLEGDLDLDLNGSNADQLDVDGIVVVGGNLILDVAVEPTADLIVLIDNDGTDAVTGEFTSLNDTPTSLADGSAITLGTKTYKIFYNGGDGNDVVLANAATPATVYVDDDWAGLNGGQTITDADSGDQTNGDPQGAIFGINAFATIADALSAVSSTGTIIVNAGDYNEAVNLTGGRSLEVTGPDVSGIVEIESLSSDSSSFIAIEGASTLVVETGDIAGVISGSGNLTKEGTSSSSTLVLRGDNTYSGITTVNRGIIQVAHSNALGATGAGSKTIVNGADSSSGARIQIRTSTALTIGEAIDFNGNASGRASLDVSSTAVHTFTGPIDVSSASNIVQFSSSSSGALRITGDITGTMSGGSQLYLRGSSTNLENHIAGSLNLSGHRLSKTDTGTWTIGSAGETYSWDSGTLIAVGTLRMGLSNIIPPGTVYLGQNDPNDATFDLNDTDQTATFLQIRYNDTSAPIVESGKGTVETGTGTLTLTGNVQYFGTAGLVNDVSSINGNLDLGGGNRSFSVADGGQDVDLQINAKITNGSITKNGDGNLVLGGSENNTGLTATVDAGTLTLAKTSNNSVHAIDGASLVVNSGGTVVIAGTGGDQILDTSDVTANGQLNVDVAEVIDALSGSGGVGVATGTTLTVGAGDASADFTGVITGDGALTKIGTGTQTLSGENTYAGDTTISDGVLKLGNNSGLGDEVGKTVINGGTLDIGGFRVGSTGNELIEVQGTGAGGIGAITNTGGTQTSAFRRITLTDDATFRADSRWDMRATGGPSILDMGGFTLTKVGTNVLTIRDTAISNHGSVDIDQGTFRLEGNTDFDSAGTIDVASGAKLDFWSNTQTHDVDVVLAGGAILSSSSSSSSPTVINGTVTLNGVVNIGATEPDTTFQRDLVISGNVEGVGGINKIGVKSVTLSGTNNTYTGATSINFGSLFLNGTHTGGDVYTVASGAMFGGTGTTDAVVVVDDGGMLSPGVSGIGTLTVQDNITISGTYTFEIDGTNADLLDVTGDIALGATAVLSLQDIAGGSPAAGETITLIQNDDVDLVTGTFNGLAEGSTVMDNDGDTYIISYAGGDGNEVVLFTGGAPETEVSFDSGTGILTITDVNGYDSADNLTISYDEANDEYVISDAALNLTTSGLTGAEMSRPDARTVRVSGANVTALVIDTGDSGGGADTLTIDVADGIPAPVDGITFTAGAGTDNLILTDSSGTAGSFSTITHTFTSESEGSVALARGTVTSTITYTGLEPISDQLTATNRVFDYMGDAEVISLSDAAAAGDMQIDSTLGAPVQFVNPSGTLTVRSGNGTGADTVNVLGLDASFTANLSVTGNNEDVVNFAGALNTQGGNINATAQNIEVVGGLNAAGGSITLNATSSTTRGIYIGGAIETTGSGRIELLGSGGGAGNQGILVEADITTATGDILITGSSSTSGDDGVELVGATVSSTHQGRIRISGSGGDGSSTFAVDADAASEISTADGSILVQTTSGSARIGGNVDSGAHALTFDSWVDLNLVDTTIVGGIINLEADNDINLTSGTNISGPDSSLGNVVVLSQNFESFTQGSTSSQVNNIKLSDNWQNAHFVTDTMDFVSDRGTTPSGETGPTVDHTLGNSSGTYLYLETSGSPGEGEFAHLLSPTIDLTAETSTAVEFYYHMLGASMGELVIEGSGDGGVTWVGLLNVEGNQGNQWNKAEIDLSQFDGSSQFQLRIKGVQGNDYTGDIALDDFRFYAAGGDLLVEDFETFGQGPTSGTRPQQVLPSGWTNVISSTTLTPDADELDWSPDRGGTPSGGTGPGGGANSGAPDHTLGTSDGTYLYIETSNPVLQGETAKLYSPTMDLSAYSTASVEFWYHMLGNQMGDLKVYGSADGGTTWSAELFSVSGNQGNQWTQTPSINLDAFAGSSNFVLRVDGIAGPLDSGTYQSDIALDDFRFFGDAVANTQITITADADGDANGSGGAINMADGSQVGAGSGNVVLHADEDITVSNIVTTSTITATSTSGAILDGGDSGTDLVAAAFVATTAGGVGTSTNAIDTALTNLEADGGSGGVFLSNTGDLIIGEAGAGFGVTAKEGATVSIFSSNDLTVAANTTIRGGTVDLSADNDVSLLNGSQILGPTGVTLLQEDFESFTPGSTSAGATNIALGNGWVNIQGTDEIDWSPDAGGTPSGGTGPGGSGSTGTDNTTGTTAGKYLFIETSDSVLEDWTAELHTPVIDLSGLSSVSLEFYYHMYAQIDRGGGATDMGTLKVFGSGDGGATWTEVFSESENQGNQWNQAVVNLDAFAGSSNFILRVDGIAGAVSEAGSAGYQSDIAIDDFTISGVAVTGSANVTITADANGDADGTGGAVNMADGSAIVAGNGTVNLTADGNVTVSSVATSGDVTISSGNGEILDRGVTPDISGGTVTFNGNVAPGMSGLGTLRVTGDLELASDDVLSLEINGTTPDTEHDQVAVIGEVSLDDATLELSLGSVPAVGSTYVIVDNDGTDAVTGTFQVNDEARGLVDLPEGSAFTVGGQVFTITYQGGTDSNDVVLTAVGEAETEVSIDINGNLVIDDINNESADQIEISVQNIGGTDYYVIRDLNTTPLTLTTPIGAAAANRISASEIHVRVDAVTGGLDVNTANANENGAADTVTIKSDLTFNGSIEINAETVVVGASVELDATTLTVNGSVDLGVNTLTVDVSSGTSRINGSIIGTGNLVKQGVGRLDLAGTVGNTYSGTTTVSGGQLHLNNSGGNAIGGDLDITTGGKVTFGRSNQVVDTAAVTMSDDGSVFNGTGVNSGQFSATETFASFTVTGGAFNTSSGIWTITGAGSFTGGAGNTTVVGNSGTRLLSFGSLALVDMTATTGIVVNSFTIYGNSTSILSTLEIGSGGLTLDNSNLNLRRAGAGRLGSRLILDGDVTTIGTLPSAIREDGAGGTIGLAEIQLNGAHNFNVGGGGADLTVSTGIADSTTPGALTKIGSGQLTLSGSISNTATGVTTLNSGTIHLNKSAGNAVGGDLHVAGGNVTFGGNHQIADTSAVSMSGAGSVFNGTGANSGNVTVTETIASLTVDGGAFNTGFGSDWTVTGAGSFTGGAGNTAFLGNSGSRISFDSLSLTDMSALANPLGAANSFAVYGNDGSVQTTVAVGSGGLTLDNSQLSMKRGGGSALGSRLVLDGDVTVNGTATSLITNDTSSGTVGSAEVQLSSTAATATRDFNIAAGAGLTINIEVNDGESSAGSVSKSGSGTLTMNADNTYQGATSVDGGILLVNGTHTGGAGYTVGAAATLGGTGATTASVNAAGGTISPGLSTGADTIDDLATGDLTLTGSTTTFAVEIGGVTGGTLHDQIDVTGTVDLGGSTLTVSLSGGFSPSLNNEFIIIDNDDTDGVTGTFDGLPEGATVTAVGGEKFTITYAGGDGNDVVLFAGEAETNVDLSGGVLTISDINNESADAISFTYDALAAEYVILDPNLVLSTSGLDASQVTRPDAHTVRIKASAVTSGVVFESTNTGVSDAADSVTIGGATPVVFPGALTVNAETIVFAGDVTLGGNSSLTGETATFNGDTDLSGDTLTLNLSVSATNSATSEFDITGGRISFLNGSEFINEGTVLHATGDATDFAGTGTVTNNGMWLQTASGGADDNLRFNGAVTFDNVGTFELTGGGDITLGNTGAVFNNSGLLVKTGSDGNDPSFVFDARGSFNNLAGGEVRATAGRLRVDTGGRSDPASEWNALGGDIGIGSGTSATSAAWTGTFTGMTSGSSHIELTSPNNSAVGNGNFVIGAGGVTFNITGNGVEWNNTSII